MKRLLIVTAMLVLCSLVAAPGRTAAQESDSAALVEAWRDGVNARPPSFETMKALFHEDAVFTLVDFPPGQTQTYNGAQEMMPLLFAIFADNSHAEGLGSPQVSGEMVTWAERWSMDSLKQMGVETVDFMFEATVLEGKFKTFTMTLSPESVAKLTGEQAPQGGEAGMPRTGAQDLPINSLWALVLSVFALVSGFNLKLVARRLSRTR